MDVGEIFFLRLPLSTLDFRLIKLASTHHWLALNTAQRQDFTHTRKKADNVDFDLLIYQLEIYGR